VGVIDMLLSVASRIGLAVSIGGSGGDEGEENDSDLYSIINYIRVKYQNYIWNVKEVTVLLLSC